MSPPAVFEGGCFCGAIRYRATGTPWSISHCHCTDCRRSSGAAFVTWASFRPADFVFTRGIPGAFRYEDRTRTFCRDCGTSLTFRQDGLDEMDLTLASLDDPSVVTPAHHIWAEDQFPWIKFADGLPVHPRSKPSP